MATIVDTALVLVDELGLEQVSVRSIAGRLSLPHMTVYGYLGSKGALLDAMYQEVTRRFYADSGCATWQGELRALCHQIRGLVLEHSRWLPLLLRPVTPPSVPLRERILDLMHADGVAPADAFAALSACGQIAMGLALAELAQRGENGRSMFQERMERLRLQSESESAGDDESLTRIALSHLSSFEPGVQFAAAIDTFIAGIEARRGVRASATPPALEGC